jgi:hypothetical protein
MCQGGTNASVCPGISLKYNDLQWNKWAIFIVVITYNLIFLNLGTVLTEHPMYIHWKVCFSRGAVMLNEQKQ